MATFEVTCEEACLIDGIGEFEPGETKVLGEREQIAFQIAHGYLVSEANFPLTVTVKEKGNEGTQSAEAEEVEEVEEDPHEGL